MCYYAKCPGNTSAFYTLGFISQTCKLVK